MSINENIPEHGSTAAQDRKPRASVSYVQDRIKSYAKNQLLSWETVHTSIMILLVLLVGYFILRLGYISVYSGIVLVFFIILAGFGIYETVPAVIMLLYPVSSRAFPRSLSLEEKLELLNTMNLHRENGETRDFLDMKTAADCVLIEGVRNIELLRWADIDKVSKTEYRHRKKYKGVYFVNLIDKDGRKHEIDIHNGKEYNPLKQMDQIFMYIQNNQTHVKIELTDAEIEGMNERINYSRKLNRV